MAQRQTQRKPGAGDDRLVDPPSLPLDRQIIDFLDGRSDGGALMRALYGDAAAEPLPPGMADLLRRWRCC